MIGVEKGDVEVGKSQKLGELEHDVYMALCWTWKHQHMGNCSCRRPFFRAFH